MSAWATQVGLVMFLAMIVLMTVRMPIAAAMFIPGALGYWAMANDMALLNLLKGSAVEDQFRIGDSKQNLYGTPVGANAKGTIVVIDDFNPFLDTSIGKNHCIRS